MIFQDENIQSKHIPGADPGFPVGGGANSSGGALTYNFTKIFQKICMKLRKFWAVGGHARSAPLDPPLYTTTYHTLSHRESVQLLT